MGLRGIEEDTEHKENQTMEKWGGDGIRGDEVLACEGRISEELKGGEEILREGREGEQRGIKGRLIGQRQIPVI